MKVENWPIEKIKPYPQNAKLHNEEWIARSIRQFKVDQPIVVDGDGVVIKGHGRLKAAEKLGLKEFPVVVRDDLTPEQVRLARIADNRSAEAGWDADVLKLEIGELDLATADELGIGMEWLESLGIDLGDVGPGADQDPRANDAPAPPKDPITKHGDIWRLGEHRLVCGDATGRAVISALVGGDPVDMVFTDPPYGVDYEGKTKDRLKIKNDGSGGLRGLLTGALGVAADNTKPGGCWYVAAPAGPQFLDFAVVLSDLGIWRQTIVWVKSTLVLGRSDYHYRHEVLFYGWKPGGAHQPPPDRKRDTVWEYDKPARSSDHPTMKPVELVMNAIKMSTRPGDAVLDVFGGSGTTVIACEKLGRRCFVAELDPIYASVIIQRWEEFAGQKAELIGADGAKNAE